MASQMASHHASMPLLLGVSSNDPSRPQSRPGSAGRLALAMHGAQPRPGSGIRRAQPQVSPTIPEATCSDEMSMDASMDAWASALQPLEEAAVAKAAHDEISRCGRYEL